MAVEWTKLMSAKRLGQPITERVVPPRTDFTRDYDRISSSSSAFRRLQDKDSGLSTGQERLCAHPIDTQLRSRQRRKIFRRTLAAEAVLENDASLAGVVVPARHRHRSCYCLPHARHWQSAFWARGVISNSGVV